MNGQSSYTPPDWARLLVYLVFNLGLSVLLILSIFGMWIGWVDSPMQRQHDVIIAQVSNNHDLLIENQRYIKSRNKRIQELVHVNRAVCINQAKTETQRGRCLEKGD